MAAAAGRKANCLGHLGRDPSMFEREKDRFWRPSPSEGPEGNEGVWANTASERLGKLAEKSVHCQN